MYTPGPPFIIDSYGTYDSAGIDFNRDGGREFRVFHYIYFSSYGKSYSHDGYYNLELVVGTGGTSHMFAAPDNDFSAAALQRGDLIDGQASFVPFPANRDVRLALLNRVTAVSSASGTITRSRRGNFDTSDERFVGVKFDLSGASFFGWIGLEVEQHRLTGRVTGWAYEDTGDPIRAGQVPEPSPLALLAMGAAGIAALRRRTRVDENDT